MLVLPCEAPTPNSSAWIASRAMDALLQEIKREFSELDGDIRFAADLGE